MTDIGDQIGDAIEDLQEAVLAAPPLVPPEQQAAFWAEVQRIVARAGHTYVKGTVYTRAGTSQTLTYRLELTFDRDEGAVCRGDTAEVILAHLRRLLPPLPRVVNLRNFVRGGGKPRPWGPFDLPKDVIRVDRGTRWGNHYAIGESYDGEFLTRAKSIVLFRAYATARDASQPDWLTPLRGMRLACWCSETETKPAEACHAEVLVELLEARGW